VAGSWRNGGDGRTSGPAADDAVERRADPVAAANAFTGVATTTAEKIT
jgi:hypothetical protein